MKKTSHTSYSSSLNRALHGGKMKKVSLPYMEGKSNPNSLSRALKSTESLAYAPERMITRS